MEMALWILFCLFASVGLVQCGYWVSEMLKRPSDFQGGYHLIQLYNEPNQLEAKLRYALSQMRRDGGDCEQVILVDMGLGDECKRICENLLLGIGGVYICDPHEIAHMLLDSDDCQTDENDVK